jgi:hypothetical protein
VSISIATSSLIDSRVPLVSETDNIYQSFEIMVGPCHSFKGDGTEIPASGEVTSMTGSGEAQPTAQAAALRSARALLGVTADVDATELTRAYWRRARCLHPDLSADPEATEQFRALHAAYRLALEAALDPPSPATASSPAPVRPTPRSTAVTVSPSAAVPPSYDGVWVVAGPVQVRPPRPADASGPRDGGP